jgi:hypothetical protein
MTSLSCMADSEKLPYIALIAKLNERPELVVETTQTQVHCTYEMLVCKSVNTNMGSIREL